MWPSLAAGGGFNPEWINQGPSAVPRELTAQETAIIQSEVSQKEKHQYSILTHIYGIWKDGNYNPVCETTKETQMYRKVFWTLWERARVG